MSFPRRRESRYRTEAGMIQNRIVSSPLKPLLAITAIYNVNKYFKKVLLICHEAT
ncbi:hypothetical protein [Candidatus Tisiphia endosymbiont of Hybos culiciformis]|uniref:hypothetical protein n=1 Tax=Candidatus Tisiphia endosymbiont of Hybos culiciformis TaxID=3139331 RepID=UPI003CCAB2DA